MNRKHQKRVHLCSVGMFNKWWWRTTVLPLKS